MSDLRTIERESIRAFVQSAAADGYLSGRVLDYGCGKQPYRDIVEAAGGTYFGFDRVDFPGSVATADVGDDPHVVHEPFDSVLMTQVLQYVPRPASRLWTLCHPGMVRRERRSSRVLDSGGILVMTYPTNWPEVEPQDLHRFTKAGMERLLKEAGFEIVLHERRATVRTVDFNLRHQVAYFPDEFALGYGVIARA